MPQKGVIKTFQPSQSLYEAPQRSVNYYNNYNNFIFLFQLFYDAQDRKGWNFHKCLKNCD